MGSIDTASALGGELMYIDLSGHHDSLGRVVGISVIQDHFLATRLVEG
jgi:hypothetical protein